MPGKTTADRKTGSAARGPRILERLLIVAAVAAVLVSVGAWFAMNRPGGGAQAAGATASRGTSAPSTGATATDAGDQAAISILPPPAEAAGDAAAGAPSAAAISAATTAAPSAAPTSALSPTATFLTALTASGLAPPVDDTQRLAMAQDVCKQLGNGTAYDDVVGALTFSGATNPEAVNFARLATTTICPQYKVG